MPKNVQTTAQLHSFHMLATSCSKYFKVLQQDVNQELPDAQAGFRQGRGIRDQIGNNRRIIEKSRELQKNTYFCLIYYVKAFVWITATVENSSRDGNTKPH